MLQPKTLEQRVDDLEKKVMAGTEFAEENTEKGKAVNRCLKDKGITKGYADDNYATFRPDLDCLREHVVTFLYRYANLK